MYDNVVFYLEGNAAAQGRRISMGISVFGFIAKFRIRTDKVKSLCRS
jgi:hypothetical protein